MRSFPEIETPALLIEKKILYLNLSEMQWLANSRGIRLRPHCKTHKSTFIAELQIEAGASGIAAAKISEAEVMAANGINDIQIANIIIGKRKIERLLKLACKLNNISCFVDSIEGAEAISEEFERNGMRMNVFVKIDNGYGRCGLNDFHDILILCRKISNLNGLRLIGITSHAGNAYSAKSQKEIERIAFNEVKQMNEIAEMLRSNNIDIQMISLGSNPTAKFTPELNNINELRTGNYVFNDMIQVSLGTVPKERCALTVLATVISVNKKSNRAVIDAGSKTFSSDKGAHGNETLSGYGFILNKNAVLERLSEEHGIISFKDERFEIGERLRIIPNHACTTINLHDFAYLVNDKIIEGKIEINARGCII